MYFAPHSLSIGYLPSVAFVNSSKNFVYIFFLFGISFAYRGYRQFKI